MPEAHLERQVYRTTALLRADEIAWLNQYHATVRERLAPRVSGDALAWLMARTEALRLG